MHEYHGKGKSTEKWEMMKDKFKKRQAAKDNKGKKGESEGYKHGMAMKDKYSKK